ncbi:MAG: GNAT family N-acetyltransferase [Cyanobacteria bacterium J06638_22]
MDICKAQLEQLDELSVLFDQYRVFYQQPSDMQAAKAFLRARLQQLDSVIFIAQDEDHAAGFTQLYPSFSSVSMKPIWILNDLFVASSYRRQGVATALMQRAIAFAKETNAIRLALATQITNTSAQPLYESLGFSKDQDFYHYGLPL